MVSLVRAAALALLLLEWWPTMPCCYYTNNNIECQRKSHCDISLGDNNSQPDKPTDRARNPHSHKPKLAALFRQMFKYLS